MAVSFQTPLDVHDERTFKAMYREHLDYVWCTLRRLGAHRVDLEDLTHDVFTVAFRKRADFDPSRPIKPWLFGIAYRVLLDFRRRDRRLVGDDPDDEQRPVASRSPEDTLMAQQEQQLLLDGLSSLEPERRALIVMHDVDGHSAPDIAQTLQLPLNTVYSRLRLSRQALGAAVKRLRAVQERGAP